MFWGVWGAPARFPRKTRAAGFCSGFFARKNFFRGEFLRICLAGCGGQGGIAPQQARTPSAAGLFRRAAVFPAERKIRFLQLCGTL
ncbi:MAG: hypothetical protein BHW65_00695 [Verrucomicrobia bacterium CAG:312_58_20]|nr:MAG: hypothetical protein BHW65_00695 [Verrucomicrobia bacterium CAG:312_58_20]